jgi:predicted XRE-type DNA-binding protein
VAAPEKEDGQEKKLVKQLQQPGDAILVTDFADTRLVSMPFCTRRDYGDGGRRAPITISAAAVPTPDNQATSVTPPAAILTPLRLSERLQNGWSQRRIERATGINQSKISNFVRGNATALTDAEQRVIVDVMARPDAEKSAVADTANQTAAILMTTAHQVMA